MRTLNNNHFPRTFNNSKSYSWNNERRYK